jgi:hypothetical protein
MNGAQNVYAFQFFCASFVLNQDISLIKAETSQDRLPGDATLAANRLSERRL